MTTSSIIYLTDLDNVIYIATKNKINNVNVPSAINKELLKVFLKSNTDNAETTQRFVIDMILHDINQKYLAF